MLARMDAQTRAFGVSCRSELANVEQALAQVSKCSTELVVQRPEACGGFLTG